MASVGRRSELQLLVFDLKYIQFKPKGAGVALYFSPEFMCKSQIPNQVNNPWYIPLVLSGKQPPSESSQVLSQIYYRASCVKEGQTPSVLIKDNNAGAPCSHYLQMDLHNYSGFSCDNTEEQEHPRNNQSSRGPSSGYFVGTLQQGRPSYGGSFRTYHSKIYFLSHLWGAYAIPLALSVVRRPSSVVNRPSCVVCVHHNYQKSYQIHIWCKCLSCSWIVPPTSVIKLLLEKPYFQIFDFFSETTSRWRFILCQNTA